MEIQVLINGRVYIDNINKINASIMNVMSYIYIQSYEATYANKRKLKTYMLMIAVLTYMAYHVIILKSKIVIIHCTTVQYCKCRTIAIFCSLPIPDPGN